MKSAFIIIILGALWLVGYVWELFPKEDIYGYLFSDNEMGAQWYAYDLIKDLRTVVMVWIIYWLMDKSDKTMQNLALIWCILFTSIPFLYMVFYFPPFRLETFALTVTIFILSIFFIFKRYQKWKFQTN